MTTLTTTSISFTKLRSGDWGVKGPASELRQGATVMVTTRSGQTKSATIAKTIWTNGNIAICAITTARPSNRHSHRGECTECGAYGPVGHSCRECYEGVFAG